LENADGCGRVDIETERLIQQELSYRKQIARQQRTQYAEGIYRHKYYTVTLKSRLMVSQGHWRQKFFIPHPHLAPTPGVTPSEFREYV